MFILFFSCSKNDDTIRPVNQESDPQPNLLEFVNTMGGSKNDSFKSITKTSDNGYIISGYTQSSDVDISDKDDDSYDFWVLKFNSENEIEWSKTFGGSGDDRASDIIQTIDGGYVILGYSTSQDQDVTTNAGLQDFWLLKLNSNGNVNWQKSLGFAGEDNGFKLIQTSQGEYMLAGELDVTASNGEGNTGRNTQRHAAGDYWVLKLDANGNLIWSKYYGGSLSEKASDIIETENGFIIVGSSQSNDIDISNNKGQFDFWVINISNTGELLWEKSYGGAQIDLASSILKTNDNNYVIVGETRSNDQDVSINAGGADLWIIKISPNGELIWEKTIGGSNFDAARSAKYTEENTIVISGNSRSSDGDLTENKGQNDVWVLELDANANIIWQKTIGGSDIDLAYDVIKVNNFSIVAVGESNSDNNDITENNGFTDALILKIVQ